MCVRERERENGGRPFASHEEKEMLAARLAMTSPQVSFLTTYWLSRDFFLDNLLVRIHLIIEMILEDRLCAMGV